MPLRRLVVPFLLLIAAAVLRDEVNNIEPVYSQLLVWLPYLILGVTITLSVYFNHSRLFTASLTLLLAYCLIQTQLQTALTEPLALSIYSMLSVALPVTLLLLFLLTDRGLRNRYGLLMAAVVPVQLLIALWVLDYYPGMETMLFINTYLPVKSISGYVLSINASGCFAFSFLVGLLLLCKHDSETLAALIAALLFGFVTLAFFDRPKISVVMFSAAGISLIISLLHSSYDMAYRDELTGLLSRRALSERLKSLGQHYVIAMADVDHFKQFNDKYGHDVGDEVLKMVARQIAGVGGGGTAYRYGGEEFCVVFTGKELVQCKPFLEEIRLAVSNYCLALRNSKHRPESGNSGMQRRARRRKSRNEETISVTISIGVSGCSKRLSKPDEVLKAADTALYKAKRNGRNCLAC
ncbi:MAG: GGDEF domain-containing protein [Gammaproteobacteria bacterium]